ncbi:hypothetical protein SBA4_500002 [Candidatus Sulfopaludibacter sp. SbA4]|nr:hypothetical protein SBA4_500002 [Candidatus Sulfopaludibacter sp. SbA4]
MANPAVPINSIVNPKDLVHMFPSAKMFCGSLILPGFSTASDRQKHTGKQGDHACTSTRPPGLGSDSFTGHGQS